MDAAYRSRLEKNISKYSWYKIFTKRVYLPLIAIQLVNVGKVTVGQIAFIAAASSILQLVLQLPSGYIADKWGNRQAILFGSGVTAISPLVYIISPTFMGGLVAALVFFGGSAFYMGAVEAFMHDTLVELGREKDYARVMGRAQSYGLIGNIFLITAIPATYGINHALPFFLGFISLAINFGFALSFTYPPRLHTAAVKKNPVKALQAVVNRYNIAVFLFAGALFGVTHRGGEYRELVFQTVGINVRYFGALLAIASLLGAGMGLYLHVLDRLKATTYFMLDLLFISACVIAIGLSHNQFLVVGGFILFAAYDRVRLILVQARLLEAINHTYKATLLSALSVFSVAGEIVVVAALAKSIQVNSYIRGYLLFGLVTLFVGSILWLLVYATARDQRAKVS